MVWKWFENGFKMGLKWFENVSKMFLKCFENGFKCVKIALKYTDSAKKVQG